MQQATQRAGEPARLRTVTAKGSRVAPVTHPRLSFSTYPDRRWQDSLNAILSTPAVVGINNSEYSAEFCRVLRAVLDKTSRFERVDVSWWYFPFVYVDVIDTRWRHYPCGHRMLFSFDVTNGLVASRKSSNEYIFARKGWGAFADELAGRTVPRYADCGQRDKTTSC